MTLHLALAAAATLVALAFSLSTFDRWLARRKPHELAWSVALALFAAGSASLWAGAAFGWGPVTFRLFYLFGAILNVPILALGTIYLLGGRRLGDHVALALAIASGFATGVLMAAPLRAGIDPAELPQGSDVFEPLPRILAAVASGGGATVIIVGAVWSAVRLLRHRGPRRLAAGNLLIATGTMINAGSGVLNSVFDEMDAFAVSLVVGIAVIFVGFLVASVPASSTAMSSPEPAEPAEPVAMAAAPASSPATETTPATNAATDPSAPDGPAGFDPARDRSDSSDADTPQRSGALVSEP